MIYDLFITQTRGNKKNEAHLCSVSLVYLYLSLYIYTHTPTELFVRMMMMVICNDILHISLF